MTTLDSIIETEIRETEPIMSGEDAGTYSPPVDQAEILPADTHTDIPAVDIVADVDVIVDVDIDVDAIAVIDVDIDIDIDVDTDVDTPHVDGP